MSWARKTHKEFEVAVHLNPSNFQAQRDLIRFEMYAPSIVGGGDDRALKHIEDLEKIDALQGQLARGEFFATKKRFAEAEEHFKAALAIESNARDARQALAFFYAQTGKLDLAEQFYLDLANQRRQDSALHTHPTLLRMVEPWFRDESQGVPIMTSWDPI